MISLVTGLLVSDETDDRLDELALRLFRKEDIIRSDRSQRLSRKCVGVIEVRFAVLFYSYLSTAIYNRRIVRFNSLFTWPIVASHPLRRRPIDCSSATRFQSA
jgi:hypothetical protein